MQSSVELGGERRGQFLFRTQNERAIGDRVYARRGMRRFFKGLGLDRRSPARGEPVLCLKRASHF